MLVNICLKNIVLSSVVDGITYSLLYFHFNRFKLLLLFKVPLS